MSRLVLTTPLGEIALALLRDAAPATAAHVARLAESGAYNGAASFYRSDFVIQFGLHGSGRKSAFGPLAVNESGLPGRVSNLRGTAAVAHWDVPDCGDSEAFINLSDNAHLDAAYGGYCVFARVLETDAASWATVAAIAAAVKKGGSVPVLKATVC
jgi:cyclophilin family peptidyl-prolyl cis-trans isomerase